MKEQHQNSSSIHDWDYNHNTYEWHEPYNYHCWDYNDYCWDYYNDYYYNCEYTDHCYEPLNYEFHEFHGGF